MITGVGTLGLEDECFLILVEDPDEAWDGITERIIDSANEVRRLLSKLVIMID